MYSYFRKDDRRPPAERDETVIGSHGSGLFTAWSPSVPILTQNLSCDLPCIAAHPALGANITPLFPDSTRYSSGAAAVPEVESGVDRWVMLRISTRLIRRQHVP